MAVIKTSEINASKDIGQVLLDAGHDVDINKPRTYFRDDLNKWSKCKPVPLDDIIADLHDVARVINPFTNQEVELEKYFGNMQYVNMGNGVQYIVALGMKIPVIQGGLDYTTAINIINDYETNDLNWKYIPPESNFRLGDFDNYHTEAECPIHFHVTGEVYAGSNESASFTFIDNGYNATDINLTEDVGKIIDTNYQVAAVVVSGSTVYDAYPSGSSLSDGNFTWSARLSPGTYKVYFILVDTQMQRIVLLPSTVESPNPVSCQVYSGTNPKYDVYRNLSFDIYGGGFNYGQYSSSAYFEPSVNIDNTPYTKLYTTMGMCFYFDIKLSDKYYRDSATIYPYKWTIRWQFSGQRGNGAPEKRIWVDGTEAYSATTGITLEKGQTYRVMIYMSNIYYNSEDYTTYPVPVSSTEEAYYSSPFYLYDENNNQFAYYYIDIRYLRNRSGYFYNDRDGFYTRK